MILRSVKSHFPSWNRSPDPLQTEEEEEQEEEEEEEEEEKKRGEIKKRALRKRKRLVDLIQTSSSSFAAGCVSLSFYFRRDMMLSSTAGLQYVVPKLMITAARLTLFAFSQK